MGKNKQKTSFFKERPSKTDSKYRTEKMKQNRDKKHLRYESFDCWNCFFFTNKTRVKRENRTIDERRVRKKRRLLSLNSATRRNREIHDDRWFHLLVRECRIVWGNFRRSENRSITFPFEILSFLFNELDGNPFCLEIYRFSTRISALQRKKAK